MLVGRRCYDGIDVAVEGQLDRGLDRVSGDSAGADDPFTVPVRVSAPRSPGPDRDSPLGRYRRYLIFRAHDGDLGVDRVRQRARYNLGADPARIAQRNGEPRT